MKKKARIKKREAEALIFLNMYRETGTLVADGYTFHKPMDLGSLITPIGKLKRVSPLAASRKLYIDALGCVFEVQFYPKSIRFIYACAPEHLSAVIRSGGVRPTQHFIKLAPSA